MILSLWNKAENQELVNAFLENELCKICALNKDPGKAKGYYTEYTVVSVTVRPKSERHEILNQVLARLLVP